MQPLTLRNITIDPPVVLAPMAGLTHVAFRQLLAGFGGCGLYMSEMLSCRAVQHETVDNSFFLKHFANERPFFYQIVGNDPVDMAKAVMCLEVAWDESGLGPDGFDINMGCGEPRLRNQGCGVGLMRNTDNARRVVAECRKATSKPLTAKIRLGWEENFAEMIKFSHLLQDEGLDAITLHPRLAKEKFKRRARWQYIGMLKKELHIPVIGNGDVTSAAQVGKRMAETGCDAVMIGRQAVRSPWIFKEIIATDNFDVNLDELYFKFTALLRALIPAERQLGRLKEFTRYFADNFTFGHRFAASIQNAADIDMAEQRAKDFFALHADEVTVTISVWKPSCEDNMINSFDEGAVPR